MTSNNGPIRRTTHACVQCRERKQKCGGVTAQARCLSCQARGSDCSFTDEARDPRFNPYLRIERSLSSTSTSEDRPPDVSRTDRAKSRSRPPTSQSDASRHLEDEVRRLREELRQVNQAAQIAKQPPPVVADPDSAYDLTIDAEDFGNPFEDVGPPSNAIPPNPSPQCPSRLIRSSSIVPDIPSDAGPTLASRTLFPSPSTLPSINSPSRQPPTSSSLSSFPSRFDGPMRVLHDLGGDDGLDLEENDPIKRQVLTLGEARRAFKLFFDQCLLNAPFLDMAYDSDMDSVRSRSPALFLNIVTIGARFWSHTSRRDTWLHSRYSKITRLLDDEMNRLMLTPRPRDNRLETVQAWMLYSHWMPFDAHSGTYRSRFSESSVWQSLGVAIRWAKLLDLETTAATPFLTLGHSPTPVEVRTFRTMLYLTESDYYLALSTRKTPTLPTTDFLKALPVFMSCQGVVFTDHRLAALSRVVQCVQVMGGHADCIESLEAFDDDVTAIDRDYTSSGMSIFSTTGALAYLSVTMSMSYDKMSQHFPFTSLRWYRLAFGSTILPAPSQWYLGDRGVKLSVEWASQIIYHLSASATQTPFQTSLASQIDTPLEPDPDLMTLLSFAIDQYFMVMLVSTTFLEDGLAHIPVRIQHASLYWLGSMEPSILQFVSEGQATIHTDAHVSILYRLVNLASRTLELCSPVNGHLANRYAALLGRLAARIASGPALAQPQPAPQIQAESGSGGLEWMELPSAGNTLWDGNWLTLLQSAGTADWPFSDLGELTTWG